MGQGTLLRMLEVAHCIHTWDSGTATFQAVDKLISAHHRCEALYSLHFTDYSAPTLCNRDCVLKTALQIQDFHLRLCSHK